MVPTHAAVPLHVAVYSMSSELVPSRGTRTAIATSSSKPAGPCHSRTAFTTITSKCVKNTSFGFNPIASKKRVCDSSKYVSQCALNTTPCASTSA